MIKKTLYFGNPTYLSLRNEQLVIKVAEVSNSKSIPNDAKKSLEITKPIEDLGYVVLDNKQITITSGALNALLANNCAVISCNEKGMPSGMFLTIDSHSVQSEKFRDQMSCSLPLRKQLWQQTVRAKIENQTAVLRKYTNAEYGCMQDWSESVKSGDSDNLEARAAAYYWKNVFHPRIENFNRSREGEFPNSLLNYGYAILRAIVARSLVVSGLLPTLGIFHRNKYNAYCLADDIMEPYRPYVDEIVIKLISNSNREIELTTDIKKEFLILPTKDVYIAGQTCPLMNAVYKTTSSLYKCFSIEQRKISYPKIIL